MKMIVARGVGKRLSYAVLEVRELNGLRTEAADVDALIGTCDDERMKLQNDGRIQHVAVSILQIESANSRLAQIRTHRSDRFAHAAQTVDECDRELATFTARDKHATAVERIAGSVHEAVHWTLCANGERERVRRAADVG